MAKKARAKRELVALAVALPADTPSRAESPPLEAEQPHQALARANAKHAKLIRPWKPSLLKLIETRAKRNLFILPLHFVTS